MPHNTTNIPDGQSNPNNSVLLYLAEFQLSCGEAEESIGYYEGAARRKIIAFNNYRHLDK